MRRAAIAILALTAWTPLWSLAQAQEVTGTWLREDGSSKVQIGRCGEALCGDLVWVRERPADAPLGQRVFYDMKQSSPGEWTGSAFNPEDGETYRGKMVLSGSRLTTSGCMLGGLICKSIRWRRAD
jgi:uncharacterized protein (DUF2147 family)